MIPSRGLRWSGQAIGIGRRRLDTFSARQFSSSVHHGPIRGSSLFSNAPPSLIKTNVPSQSMRLLRAGAGIRFASTTPVSNPSPPPVSTPAPVEAVSSSASSAPVTEYTSSLDGATDFGSESLYNIPESIGYLKAMGLDYGWGPTALMEWTLEHIHVFAGTPWWVSISLTAILVRAVLFKPYIDAADNGARLATIQPLTAPITAKMQAASTLGQVDEAMRLRGELQRVHQRAGIKYWKSFVPMLQVFAGYGTFVILRAMSRLPVPGLETGGLLWIHNLTVPDPTWILPLATAGVLHWLLRKGGETGVSTMSPQVMNAMMYGLPVVSFGFTFWLPAALQLSFFVSGLLSFGQATLLKQTWFRDYFKLTPIPTKPKGPPSPYKGSINVRAKPVLSQEELNSRFQGANTSTSQTIKEIKNMSPPKTVIGKLVGNVTGTVNEIRNAGKGVYEKGTEVYSKRVEKSTIKEQKRYEEKRQEELKRKRWELENQQRAERAARKRQNL